MLLITPDLITFNLSGFSIPFGRMIFGRFFPVKGLGGQAKARLKKRIKKVFNLSYSGLLDSGGDVSFLFFRSSEILFKRVGKSVGLVR